MAPTVRLAGEGDLAAILALLAQLNPDDPPLDAATAAATWRRVMDQPGVDTLVACLGETVVACLTLVIVPNLSRGAQPYSLIENVVTDAAHRGRRIGRILMDAALCHAWDQGAYKVMLMTGSKNPATIGFYRAAGFTDDKTAFQRRQAPCAR